MLTNKYFIESKQYGLSLVIGYNEDGVFCYFDASELSSESITKFLNYIPMSEIALDKFKKRFPKISVTNVQTDLSFKAAYDAYDYKVGKKAISEKLWEKLNDGQRLAFFKSLPRYNRHLEFTKVGKAYLETFLRNQYWENEYKY